jgi:hypothetical protein
MGLRGGIRSGEGQVKPKATAKSNGTIVVGENVGVEKRISPLCCSQNTRAASVEMTISCHWEKRTDDGNGKRRFFDYSTHDNAVSAFAQDEKSTFGPSVLGFC